MSAVPDGWPDDDAVPNRGPAISSGDARKLIEPGSQRDAEIPRQMPFGDTSRSGEMSAISTFFHFQPFMSYFCRLSHAQYPEHMSPEERVRRHRIESHRLYRVCVTADLIVMTLTTVLFLVAAGAIAYKAILS